MKKLVKSISKSEWRFVIFLSLAVIIITSLPLLYGWLITPADKTISGIHFAIPADVPVYYNYIEQVRQGHFLFDNLYAWPDQKPVLNIFWLAIGLLARLLPFSNLIIFNLARIILIPIAVMVIYLFVSYIFTEVKKRQLSLILLVFSGGLGGFFLDRLIRFPGNYQNGQLNWPMDLWVPELNIFSSLYYSPHFIASWALLLLVFLFSLLYWENQKVFYSLAAGLSALVLFAFHPFNILTVFGVLAVYSLILIIKNPKIFWPVFQHGLVVFFLSLPAIAYYFYLTATDWVMAAKAQQNFCPTTPLTLTFISYGVILILALVGVYFLIKKKQLTNLNLFFVVWALVQFVLIYAPVNYQRRLTESLQFPLVILAVFGLFYWLDWQKIAKIFHPANKFFLVTLLLFFSSNLVVLGMDLYIYQNTRFLAYLDNDLLAAAAWLKNNTTQTVVLADYLDSNVIPAYSGRAVYVGHGVETPFFDLKRREMEWFFLTNRPEAVETKFLANRKINYIFFGPNERQLGNFNPEVKTYLKKVYSGSQDFLYQVL